MTNPFTPVSKVGDWKTIQQRELKAAGARKKQRRSMAAAGAMATGGVALAARNPQAARRAASGLRQSRNLKSVNRVLDAEPIGSAAVGLPVLAGGMVAAAGHQRGVEAYHQHKINQRRRNNRVRKNVEQVVPASRKRPQVSARMAVRRPRRPERQRPGNPFLIQKASWSDQRLNQHKKAQAGISTVGATLGVGALGAAGLAAAARRPEVARRIVQTGRRTPQQVKDSSAKFSRAGTGLTTGAAGVGGVGGFNFAAIQSQEAKQAERNARMRNTTMVHKAVSGLDRAPVRPLPSQNQVRKNMSTSVWGIDHGEPIEKRFGMGAMRNLAGSARSGAAQTGGAIRGAASRAGGAVRTGATRASGAVNSGYARAHNATVDGAARAGMWNPSQVSPYQRGSLTRRGRAVATGAGATGAGVAAGGAAGYGMGRRNGVSKAEPTEAELKRMENRSAAYLAGGTAGGAAAGASRGYLQAGRRAGRAGYGLSRSLGGGRGRSAANAVRTAATGARKGKAGLLATGVGATAGMYAGMGTAGAQNLKEYRAAERRGN